MRCGDGIHGTPQTTLAIYQGAIVGWPFTSASGADCIVWLTGEEAFLECIKTVGTTKRRTMAGFWGYGQWRVQTSNTQVCLQV